MQQKQKHGLGLYWIMEGCKKVQPFFGQEGKGKNNLYYEA